MSLTLTIAVGSRMLIENKTWQVVEREGIEVVLRHEDRYRSMSLARLIDLATPMDTLLEPHQLVSLLHRQAVQKPRRSPRRQRTCEKSTRAIDRATQKGHSPKNPGLSTARTETTPTARQAAKAAELGVGLRTLQRWWSNWKESGEAGLVSGHHTRGRPAVDERWDAERSSRSCRRSRP